MRFLIPALQKLLSYLITKILLAFGVSFVTYTGYSVGLNTLKGYVSQNFNNMPADVFQILMIAGAGQAIGMLFGAFAFNITMSTVSKLSFGKGKK